MSDQISRQKLIEKLMECSMVGIGKRNPKGSKEEMLYEDYIKLDTVLELIESQPPADVPDTIDGEWIPCSERLPKQYERVLVTATVMQTVFLKESKVAVDVGYLITEGVNEFILSAAGTRQYVKAWMPLPEPYKGVE